MLGRRHAAAASRFRTRDLGSEALAGLLQRPGRSALTMVGTVLGIGAFVAIVGLSQTASGQIGKQFNQLEATQVMVLGPASAGASAPAFPPDADAVVDRINGVVAAGVWWMVPFTSGTVSAMPGGNQRDSLGMPVTAATPGALAASGAVLREGVLYDQFHEARAQNVAVVGAAAATQLRLSSLENRPAIFIAGQPFTVVGILAGDQRLPQLNFGVSIPASAAWRLWGAVRSPIRPHPQMLIHTRLGAAQVVAKEVPIALRPDDPQALRAFAPPNPSQLKHSVTASLNTLFLALAGIALVVGAVGIANTTLVAVLERTGEIGLRRAVGARPVHYRLAVPDRVHGARPVRWAHRCQPGGADYSRGHDPPPLDRDSRPARGAGGAGCRCHHRAARGPVSSAARQQHRTSRCAAPVTSP